MTAASFTRQDFLEQTHCVTRKLETCVVDNRKSQNQKYANNYQYSTIQQLPDDPVCLAVIRATFPDAIIQNSMIRPTQVVVHEL